MGRGHNALSIVQKYFPSVKSVEDADNDLLLEVTASDSSDGSIKDHNNCAFAKACQRKFKARGVIVSVNTVYVVMKEGAVRYKINETTSREIVSFDRKAGFAQGEYMLKAPPKSARLGARHERAADKRESHKAKKPGKLSFRHHTTGIRTSLNTRG